MLCPFDNLQSTLDHAFHVPTVLKWLSGVALLYPELHYVFRWFPFSRYRIREPEVVFDAPFRVDPGAKLPVMLLLKDAHRYPVHVQEVTIHVRRSSIREPAIREYSLKANVNQLVDGPWWHRVVEVDVPDDFRGSHVLVDCECRLSLGGRSKTIRNDNFPGLTHDPLTVYCAAVPLPAFEGWHHGDLHYHTDYTTDQVEFGAPLPAAIAAGQAIGMKFLAATDHSYDLDDLEGDFLHNDPELRRWKKSRAEIDELNRTMAGRFVVLPGEEVSCANSEGRNVHMLVLNEPSFLPGSGDSAEQWMRTRSELSVSGALNALSKDAMAMAAHPKDPAPPLEKALIRRGRWEDDDLLHVCHLQVLNGSDNKAFREGLDAWVRRLLAGERVFLAAGNDAHGNFNRFRQVRTPMLSLHEERDHQRFGWARTCIRPNYNSSNNELSVASIMESLRNGRSIITTGPVVRLEIHDESGSIHEVGDTGPGGRLAVRCAVRSSREFGELARVTVVAGLNGKKEENILDSKEFDQPHDAHVQGLYVVRGAGYVRAEVVTSTGYFCFSNPIWLA